jgi:hypothetical protein
MNAKSSNAEGGWGATAERTSHLGSVTAYERSLSRRPGPTASVASGGAWRSPATTR